MENNFRRGALSVGQQILYMKEVCPSFRLRSHGNRVVWSGVLRPISLSASYLVEIEYKQNERPDVRVLSPDLGISRAQFKEVHIFRDGSLCLHKAEDWNPSKPIATTILLWANEWLIYYELWKATAKWFGGGEYIVSRRDKKRKKRD